MHRGEAGHFTFGSKINIQHFPHNRRPGGRSGDRIRHKLLGSFDTFHTIGRIRDEAGEAANLPTSLIGHINPTETMEHTTHNNYLQN